MSSRLTPSGATPVAVAGLDLVKQAGRKRPPVDSWNPELVREIDMRIAADGAWFYMGTPIARPAMVRLFASILRREDDGRYALVTPVEKCLITVDDAPFVATAMIVEGDDERQQLRFETNTGDLVSAGAEHPLRFSPAGEAHIPYVTVWPGLEARLNRSVAYELMELCEVHEPDSGAWYGVWAGGEFWPVMPRSDLGADD